MRSLIESFSCGNICKRGEVCDYRITSFEDISEKIIPFFKKYPIQGEKSKDFQDWCKVANMIKEKYHLTKEGLEEIKKIKAGMNTGRKID